MDEWQEIISTYSKQLAHGFRQLGIEKTQDELRTIIEEELVNAKRQHIREMFYRLIAGDCAN